MKKILFVSLLFLVASVNAQEYVHQVFILNEGYFDYTINQSIEPVTVGSYNPNTQTYNTIDTIHGARFASDLVVDNDYFYVAADNKLFKYDKDNYTLLASQNIDGVRNLAIWNDKIIVTKGDYDNINFSPIFFNSYLQIYNKSDLSLFIELDTIVGPKWSTQNIIIDDNKAYVAINNAYQWGNYKGAIGILDLNTYSYLNEFDLGPDGKNPDNMMKDGNNIYTINNKDWSGSSISKFSLLTNSVSTINLSAVSTGCGTSCMRDGMINYQLSGDSVLYEWSTVTLPNNGLSLGFNKTFYDLSFDIINNQLYSSTTDYSTYGEINIYNQNNTLINSFACGISPGNIVFDIRTMSTSNIEDISSDFEEDGILYDLSGRRINTDICLPDGVYISNGKRIYIKR
jgi:hypothetical protein